MTDRWLYVSPAGVRRRGWSDAMIRELLGLPDVQGRDPRRYALRPLRLYLLARVEAVERTPEFAAASSSLAVRGRGSAVGVLAEGRRAAVLAAIRAEPLLVPRLPAAELERRAARHRRLMTAGGAGGAGGGEGGGFSPGAPARWQVGYLRQTLARYETLLDGLYGDTGRREAERLLRRRQYEAIAAAYPALAPECARRIALESR
ncbi:hypothetical protein HHL19_14600 [Streptomyces sp. R302]|uniref:hypothetical protein n=1 Tax=unclassified Streptomyces TaxID=2593676 RepID=UPI00145F1A12|nr:MULTISPECIES: hypothetical protein [unclassified Streptomyces]NML51301.1 hypothetical protein [Streptomyces sp. R301]NML79879.1 hypothetical protein [Streptomyces sp. R302]